METKRKKALIAVNNIGFMWFLMEDIDILRSLGFEDITVAADNSANEDFTVAELTRRGVKFVEVRCDFSKPISKVNWHAYKNYRGLITKEKFDVIICHTPITGMIVRLSSIGLRKKGTKIVYVSHGLPWTKLSDKTTRIKFRLIEDIGSRLCDAIIVINEEDRLKVEKMHCPKVYKIDGIGFNVSKYRDAAVDKEAKRMELGIPLDKKVVLAVGEISQRKNHKIIVDALALLPNKQEYVFVICGNERGGKVNSGIIMQKAGEYGIDVRMLGFRKDVYEIFHIADIGVIPSIREGLGLAGVQQLCAGVPVIGTDVQGIKEYVLNGVTGFLVSNPHDAQSFSECIKKLSNDGVKSDMRENCIKIVERFSKEKSVNARMRIYSEVFGI